MLAYLKSITQLKNGRKNKKQTKTKQTEQKKKIKWKQYITKKESNINEEKTLE